VLFTLFYTKPGHDTAAKKKLFQSSTHVRLHSALAHLFIPSFHSYRNRKERFSGLVSVKNKTKKLHVRVPCSSSNSENLAKQEIRISVNEIDVEIAHNSFLEAS